MKLNIKETNIKLSEANLGYIEKKLQKTEKLLGLEVGNIFLEIERETKHKSGLVFRAEIQMSANGVSIRAEAPGETWKAALDKTAGIFKREIKKHKEKVDN